MQFLPLFIAVPLLIAFAIPLFAKLNNKLPDILGNFTALYLLTAAVGMYFIRPFDKTLVYKMGGWAPPFGINLVLDGLSHLLLFTISLLAFLAAVYSIAYMKKYTAKGKYYTLFLLMLAGMNGVVLTGDLFNLYVFLEIAAVASYALVAFGTEAEELEASFKYLIMGAVASAFILLGIGIIYGMTGSLNMADVGQRLMVQGASAAIMFVAALFIMGFGMKAALVPFHAWLPDAHPSAPAPISAMLSGVLIKALGIYALIRIFFNVLRISPQLSYIFMALGGTAIILAGFLALGQEDIKRLLAYSSISQVGYIILAVAIGTPLGVMAGLFHLFNHAVFKGLLFLNAGAVEYATGTRELSKMGGLNHRMPVTSVTSLIGSLAISGIPPFNGFWSKFFIVLACIQIGRVGYAALAVIGSILTLAALLKLQKRVFFGNTSEFTQTAREVPGAMVFSMIILAGICLGVGLLFPFFTHYFIKSGVIAVVNGLRYSKIVLGGL